MYGPKKLRKCFQFAGLTGGSAPVGRAQELIAATAAVAEGGEGLQPPVGEGESISYEVRRERGERREEKKERRERGRGREGGRERESINREGGAAPRAQSGGSE